MNEKMIKKICNVCVVIMFSISVLMLLRYSSLPNYFNIPFMEHPAAPSSIGMSLFTSFVVTAVFYFFMNYIPDVLNIKEQERKELPKRIAIHRDIQLFLARYFALWGRIVMFVENRNEANKTYCVDEIFDDVFIKEISIKILMHGVSNTYSPDGVEIVWKRAIYSDLSDLINRGNKILEIYSADLPEEVHFYLNYLIKEDNLLYGLHSHIGSFYDELSSTITLYNLIGKNGDGNLNLKQTRRCLNYLYDWVNCEYEDIVKKGGAGYSDRIYRIDIRG